MRTPSKRTLFLKLFFLLLEKIVYSTLINFYFNSIPKVIVKWVTIWRFGGHWSYLMNWRRIISFKKFLTRLLAGNASYRIIVNNSFKQYSAFYKNREITMQLLQKKFKENNKIWKRIVNLSLIFLTRIFFKTSIP